MFAIFLYAVIHLLFLSAESQELVQKKKNELKPILSPLFGHHCTKTKTTADIIVGISTGSAIVTDELFSCVDFLVHSISNYKYCIFLRRNSKIVDPMLI